MNKDVEASLKSLETENFLDRVFYRPVGYKIAKAIQNTGITPNIVTIISIFIGVSAGIFWWFPYNITLAFLGVAVLIIANISGLCRWSTGPHDGYKIAGRTNTGWICRRFVVSDDLHCICTPARYAVFCSLRSVDIRSDCFYVSCFALESGIHHRLLQNTSPAFYQQRKREGI